MVLKLLDWFSMTSKIDSVESLQELLSMRHCEWQSLPGKGARGYVNRTYFDGISIHSDGRPDMGIWLEMSGTGCRSFESYGSGDWALLLAAGTDSERNITRIDAAIDDKSGLLPLDKIAQDVLAGNFVSRWNWYKVEQSSDGVTVYLGSPTSDIRLRIYDKAAQTGRQSEGSWIRVELQMRDENATAFATRFLDGSGADEVLLGVLCNYARFVQPSKTDSKKRRWKMRPYWSKFLGGVEALRLWSRPGVEYNLHNLKKYVLQQAGNSIKTYCEIYGAERLCALMEQREAGSLPVRYQELIQRTLSMEGASCDEN